MKNIFTLLLLLVSLLGNSQETKKVTKYDTIFETKTIKIIDTIYEKTSSIFKNDTLNETIVHSEYNGLYEKLLDQKNNHYDSAVSFLEVLFAILALVIVIVLTASAYLGFNEFKSMKSTLRTDLAEEKNNIEKRINSKVEELTRLKYEKDITELKESYNNLERFAQDASISFSVKRGHETPTVSSEIETPKTQTNPFDKK